MMRQIISIVTILLLPIAVHAQQIIKSFTPADVQAAIDGASSGKNHCFIRPAYGGSDTSGFAFHWHDAVGNYVVLNFDAKASDTNPQSLCGWIGKEPVNGPLTPVELMLVYTDNFEAVRSTSIPPLGTMVPFKLQVPSHARSEHLTLLMHVPDQPTHGTVTFSDLQMVTGSTAAQTASAAAVAPGAWPTTMPGEQLVRSFSGDDFAMSSAGPFENEGVNPVSVRQASHNPFRSIEVLVPSPNRTIPILSVDDPGITAGDYAIAGDVAYGNAAVGFTISSGQLLDETDDGNIEGTAYLEMWSDFADGGSYFTRTLAGSGPMRMLQGRSGPRAFLLPFHAGDLRPTRIRMNLVMPGRGRVSLANLRLVQYPKPVPATATSEVSPPWFNARLIWLPVIVLPFFSMVGLLEPLVLRGKGRTFVMIWIWTFFVLSELSFGWGMAAWGHGLPVRDVWPTLFASGLILFATLFSSRRMPRRYRDVELKRIQLMDAV